MKANSFLIKIYTKNSLLNFIENGEIVSIHTHKIKTILFFFSKKII